MVRFTVATSTSTVQSFVVVECVGLFLPILLSRGTVRPTVNRIFVCLSPVSRRREHALHAPVGWLETGDVRT